MVEELLPASVAMVAEVDVDERIVSRLDGFFNELHAGVFGYAAALPDVACGTGANDVLPGGFSAQRPGDYMVEG